MSKPDPGLLHTVIELCAEAWPQAFFINPQRRKPLKVGIHHDILALTGDTLDPQLLSGAMRVYCSNLSYLGALTGPGAIRLDLAGNPAGHVTDDERERARTQFAALLMKLRNSTTNSVPTQTGKPAAGPRRVPGKVGITDVEQGINCHGPEPPSISS
jgi:sRNA-binding protein